MGHWVLNGWITRWRGNGLIIASATSEAIFFWFIKLKAIWLTLYEPAHMQGFLANNSAGMQFQNFNRWCWDCIPVHTPIERPGRSTPSVSSGHVRHEVAYRSCSRFRRGNRLCHRANLGVWIKSDPDNVTKRRKVWGANRERRTLLAAISWMSAR